MNNIDLIVMALKNLFKRKLRTFLTILGVSIGTASIIVMISLGLAINKNFESQLLQLSDITLIHVVGVDETSQQYQTKKNKIKLDNTAVYNFKQIKNVEAVSPIINLSYSIKALCGKYCATLNVVGIEASFLKILGYELENGRFLNEDDKLNIVCGGKVPYSFRKKNSRNYIYYDSPQVNLMKERVTISTDMNYGEVDTTDGNSSSSNIKSHAVKFVGILKSDESGWSESDYNCYMTIEQTKKLKAEMRKKNSGENNSDEYNQIYVKCKNINSVKDIAEKVKELGYNAYYEGEYLENMRATSANMQALLGAIGAVSLFVAAIGIANTMIMSVYERTREIGIMKVIGASIRDIKKLFLLESSIIGFFGGITGTLISLLVSHILNTTNISFFNTNVYMYSEKSVVSLIPIWLCVVAIIFSGLIGLFSGYFPARRATKLSVLVAIKAE